MNILQRVHKTKNETITISLIEYGGEYHVRKVITSNDENYSRLLEFIDIPFDDYEEAESIYIDENYLAHKHCTSESGQMIVLFLLALVCIAFVLYLCYTGISLLSGSEGGLFQSMLSGISEVIK